MDDKENCPNVLPSFAAEETPRIGRGRKGAGNNLRKSLAWNNAFFTDEGVLDPVELSGLSGNPGGKSLDCNNAKQESGSSLCSKSRTRSHTSDTNLSRLGSEIDFRISSTPMSNILQESSSKTTYNSSLLLSANSQKRVVNASTTKQQSKLPKLKSGHCPLVRAPNSFYPSKKSAQHEQNLLPVGVLESEGSRSASNYSRKAAQFSTDSRTVDSASAFPQCDGSETLISRPALPTNSKTSEYMAVSKTAATHSLASSNVSQSQSVASHSKPSALRMPSPSLGFFVQGKPQISSQTYAQKCTQSTVNSDKQLVRKASITNYASLGKNTRMSSVKPPIAGSTTTARDAGTKYTEVAIIDNHTDQSREPLYQNCVVKSHLELKSSKRKLPIHSSIKRDERLAPEINTNDTLCTKEILVNGSTDKLDNRGFLEVRSNEMLSTETVIIGGSQEISGDVKGHSLVGTNSAGLRLSDSVTFHQPCSRKEAQQSHMSASNIAIPASSPDEADGSAAGNSDLCDMPDSVDPWTSKSSNNMLNANHLSTVDMYSSIQVGTLRSTATSEEMKDMPSPIKDMCADASTQDIIPLKPHLNAMPFTDEWIAAAEAFGEDILKMKTGAVQNSPTEKKLPESSPWSPVKKNHDVGPFDCTKIIKGAPSSSMA